MARALRGSALTLEKLLEPRIRAHEAFEHLLYEQAHRNLIFMLALIEGLVGLQQPQVARVDRERYALRGIVCGDPTEFRTHSVAHPSVLAFQPKDTSLCIATAYLSLLHKDASDEFSLLTSPWWTTFGEMGLRLGFQK